MSLRSKQASLTTGLAYPRIVEVAVAVVAVAGPDAVPAAVPAAASQRSLF